MGERMELPKHAFSAFFERIGDDGRLLPTHIGLKACGSSGMLEEVSVFSRLVNTHNLSSMPFAMSVFCSFRTSAYDSPV